jgi:hypothetical protein
VGFRNWPGGEDCLHSGTAGKAANPRLAAGIPFLVLARRQSKLRSNAAIRF